MSTPEEIAKLYMSPRAIRLDNLERYVKCTQYEGRADWFDTSSQVPLFERKPCINYPIVKSAIGSHVSFVLGEGRWPRLTSATSEDDRTIDEDWGLDEDDSDLLDRFINTILVRHARLKQVARELLADAMASKSVAVIASVQQGRLCVESVKAGWCTPTLGPLGECLKLEIRYPYIEEFYNDRTRKYETRCMLYRRVIDDKTDKVYLPAPGNAEGKEPDWSVDSKKTRDHGLGFCPVLWYPFMKPCSTANTIDGCAIHEAQLEQVDCLNITLSQKQRAAVTAGDPQMFETGVDPDHNPAPMGQASRGIIDQQASGPDGKPVGVFGSSAGSRAMRRMMARKRGAGVIWRYPDKDSKVGYITLPPDALKAVDEHARDLRGKLAESMFAVFFDPAELKMHAALSGKALSFIFAHQLSFDDKVRDDFSDNAFLPLVSMLLRIIYVIGKKQKKAGSLYIPGIKKILPILENFQRDVANDDGQISGETWLPPRLESVWGPYFAPNEQDQLAVVTLVTMALEKGTITLEAAVEKLSQSGVFEIGSAKEFAEAIVKEKQANAAMQLAQVHALSGGDTGGAGSTGSGGGATGGSGAGSTGDPTGSASMAGGSSPGGSGGSTGASAALGGASGAASAAKGASAKPGAKAGAGGNAAAANPNASNPNAAPGLHQAGVSTSGVTETVYNQLLVDYPPEAIQWVRAARWEGPINVPTSSIDYSNASEWRASKDGKLPSFVEKIQQGIRKPLILINEPNNERLIVADGHHRALAYQQIGEDAPAYVAHVTSIEGPWDEMHADQEKKGSKTDGGEDKGAKDDKAAA